MKELFNLEENITYLNCAYLGPLLKSAEAAGIKGLSSKGRPYNIVKDDFFDPPEAVREKFSQLINAQDAQRIALIPSVSYAMANVANNISFTEKDEIVVVDEQFPSNIYAWKKRAADTGAKIRVAATPPIAKGRGKQWNENILALINENTRLIAIATVHWADGTRYDLEAIRKKATAHDALLIVDGTQSVGALPFDVQKVKPDALICAAYKWLLGPYTSGFAYYGPFFDQGEPIENNWIARKNSDDFGKLLHYQEQYRDKANRYMMGEYSNFIAIPMLDAALTQLLAWTPEKIQAHCQSIVAPYLPNFERLGCFIEEDEYRGQHLFGIHLPKEMDIAKLKAAFKANNIHVSQRGPSVRVSPHLYNSREDMERLLACFSV